MHRKEHTYIYIHTSLHIPRSHAWVIKVPNTTSPDEHRAISPTRAVASASRRRRSTSAWNEEKFQQLGLNEKIQFANRKAVGAGGKRQLVVKPPSDKTATEPFGGDYFSAEPASL